MSNFNELKIKLSFSCGASLARQEDCELLSDYWTEEDWSNLSEKEKNNWLYNFYEDWKSNYEDGGAWIE